ncbi:hypothetical protein PJP12_30015, partial [Mycobacterium kansasii]
TYLIEYILGHGTVDGVHSFCFSSLFFFIERRPLFFGFGLCDSCAIVKYDLFSWWHVSAFNYIPNIRI